MAAVDVLWLVLLFSVGIPGLRGADVWTSEGQSVVLPCGITYNPAINLFWQLQPVNINILFKDTDGNIEVLERQWEGRVDIVDDKKLRIRNVSRQDDSSAVRGEYRCAQQSTVGERSQLRVRYPPSSIGVTGYNSTSLLRHGDELQLSCDIDNSNPAPSFYSWYKNGLKIGDDRTLNINPVKMENHGDIIKCSARVYDQNHPVFDWEGESNTIMLSVTDDEPGDGTTVGGAGNGVNVGLAVGLSVAAVAVIIILIAVIIRMRNRPHPTTTDPPITNGGVPATVPSISGGTTEIPGGSDVGGTGNGLGYLENGTLPNGDIPMRPLPPAVHDENEFEDDPGPSGPATGEFEAEYVGPPIRPEDDAEPEAVNSTSDSGDIGNSERPTSSHSDRPDLGPVQETTPGPDTTRPTDHEPPVETTPLMPQSDLDQLWSEVLDIVENQVRSSTYRKRLGRKLGLTESELEEIEENYHHLGAREKLRQVLIKWEEKDCNASPKGLAAALRRMECNRVAKMVEQCWESYGSP
ncbi:uncharacterized protein LOC144866850 [Branchiostoma floridae x Branchiostoma japonicum]